MSAKKYMVKNSSLAAALDSEVAKNNKDTTAIAATVQIAFFICPPFCMVYGFILFRFRCLRAGVPPFLLAAKKIAVLCLNRVLERPMPEPGFKHLPGVGQTSGLENQEKDNHRCPTDHR